MSEPKEGKWHECTVCSKHQIFKNVEEYHRHLRKVHCTKEGGSFVCRYGYNGVCNSLPVEGVSSKDYEDHVVKHHGATTAIKSGGKRMSPSGNQGEVRTNGAVDKQPNVFACTQVLPSILSDPGKAKERDFFTKTWGDSFVEKSEFPPWPGIPQVDHTYFESYLRKTSKRYKRHARCSLSQVRGQRVEDLTDTFDKLKGEHASATSAEQLIPKKVIPQGGFNYATTDIVDLPSPNQRKTFHWVKLEEPIQ